MNPLIEQMKAAIETDDLPAVIRILDLKDPSLNVNTDLMGNNVPALVYCTGAEPRLQIATELIRRGADVNMQNTDGWTALHCAAEHGNKELAQLLIDNHARLDIEVIIFKDPYRIAKMNGFDDVAAIFEKAGLPQTVLNNAYIDAAASGDVAEVTRLLDMSADIHAVNSKDESALKLAIEKQHIGVLDILIARDAVDLFDDDKDGLLPLNRAAKGYPKSLERLLRECVTLEPDALHRVLYAKDRTTNLDTMLSAAVNSDNLECVQMVLAAGVDPYSRYTKDKMIFENKSIEAAIVKAAHKFSLLNALAQSDRQDALGLMDDKTIDVNSVGGLGYSALYLVIHNDTLADTDEDHAHNDLLMDKLLSCGANPNQIMPTAYQSILAEAFVDGANVRVLNKLIDGGGRVDQMGVSVKELRNRLRELERPQELLDILNRQFAVEFAEKAITVQKKTMLMPQIKLRK